MISIINETKNLSKYNKKVGLVPTMGNLHEGHLELVKQSLSDNEVTIVTIFVNPLQFGQGEDFESYPRTLQEDVSKLESISNNNEIIIFAPKSTSEIFPEDYSTTISLGSFTDKLCGKSRPGHFDGVTTVVYRLFALTNPTNAYFGQKDFQQYLAIKKMTSDLLLPVNLHMVPIKRDQSGLALSSRNQYLSNEEKKEALILSKTLNEMKNLSLQDNINKIEILRKNSLKDKKWDYLEILDANNLETPSKSTLVFIAIGAIKIGKARLIDNIIIEKNNA